jgi:hypothetical protein
MEEYTLRIVYKILFKWGQKKKLQLDSYKDINAIYDYDNDNIILNICSDDFDSLKTEQEIMTKFGKEITHELLHREIFHITSEIANEGEERVIDKILG